MEGTVSQDFDIGPSFYFMSNSGYFLYTKAYIKILHTYGKNDISKFETCRYDSY